ncbi:hypothetical protein [Brachybacterium massiliense]|uniref:hypothetical protein n=1 Tax=Brachybacterium massiliense TaxID=1755098 RepID=UPI000B3BAEED|nr:hypothetical protein [Brachybacterium massiliense]
MSVDLFPRERQVLRALRFLVDDESKVTVSQRDLATALGWRRHSGMRNDIRSLERHGLVRVYRNGPDHQRRPCTFEVTALGHEVTEAALERSAA